MEYFDNFDFIDDAVISEFPEFFCKTDNDAPTEFSELDRAIRFDMNRTCDNEEFDKLCASIKSELSDIIKDNKHTDVSLRSVIANLVHAI